METVPDRTRDMLEQDGTPPSAGQDAQAFSGVAGTGAPEVCDPDLAFIDTLVENGGATLKHCFQCGTCSAVCALTPDTAPFPRKEMAWAGWGLKAKLLSDPDVWLCYQCNDCSTRCPRGARPGDVLAAVRRSCVLHYAVPRFLGRWCGRARYLPLLLAIPTLLLGFVALMGLPFGGGAGDTAAVDERIVFAYSVVFPHRVLNLFFLFFGALALIALIASTLRFWRALNNAPAAGASGAPARSLLASIGTVARDIFSHRSFAECQAARSRLVSHALVLYGFIALTVVTLWVITARYNPLLENGFIYPFSFWNPWKMLANSGGLAVALGLLLMIRDRLRSDEPTGGSSYFDWWLLATLFAVVVSGFITEGLHYARMEPHRHVAYFIHLVLVFTLLIYLPYSKLAHLCYRATAMVYAEYKGRGRGGAHRGEDRP